MNYYNILGVPENASQEEIREAYRNMIKAFHPDYYRGSDTEFAERKTRELIEAYDVLRDPETRAEYDVELQYQEKGYYYKSSSFDNMNTAQYESTESTDTSEEPEAEPEPAAETPHEESSEEIEGGGFRRFLAYVLEIAIFCVIFYGVMSYVLKDAAPEPRDFSFTVLFLAFNISAVIAVIPIISSFVIGGFVLKKSDKNGFLHLLTLVMALWVIAFIAICYIYVSGFRFV